MPWVEMKDKPCPANVNSGVRYFYDHQQISSTYVQVDMSKHDMVSAFMNPTMSIISKHVDFRLIAAKRKLEAELTRTDSHWPAQTQKAGSRPNPAFRLSSLNAFRSQQHL